MAEADGRNARDFLEWRDLRNLSLALRLEGKRAKWLLRYKRQPQHSLWRNPAFEQVNDTHLIDLKRADIERVRDHILTHSGGTRSNRAVAYIRSAFNWASRHHSARSGLRDTAPWWTMVGEIHHEQPRETYLTIKQVGRLLAVAEANPRQGRALQCERARGTAGLQCARRWSSGSMMSSVARCLYERFGVEVGESP
ncbi:hypothetical protein [Aquibaculum sediminis]|uniref:hypothetical protein n=1 Tax=Aquibaculum sediminis TaxID=3231907 RepID=UPI0034530A20